MEIYTVGFTKKTAAEFFEILKQAGIKQLLDIRLNNLSQLAGFTKRDDLLALHARLFEAGLPGCDDAAAAALCRQLADLSEDAGANWTRSLAYWRRQPAAC